LVRYVLDALSWRIVAVLVVPKGLMKIVMVLILLLLLVLARLLVPPQRPPKEYPNQRYFLGYAFANEAHLA